MSNLLDKIKNSDDVKKLSLEEKGILCNEIRGQIIDTVSKNGGHLASNLGVVELTVALFSKFSLPNDSIVWDVGHQCYTHKLLTGRQDSFKTLRQEGGVSGFPCIEESDCDSFTTGHSSVSISSAYGLSVASKIKKEKNYTVCVIGDGALTGGVAYEALNNAGRRRNNFIVILNDNNMSISKNVGAMSRHLGLVRSKNKYINFKSDVENTFSHIPLVGGKVTKVFKKIKNVIKRSIYNTTIFDDMGFSYYGPYDGHDITQLEEIFDNAKKIKKPVLIHVKTTKGKGYSYAEDNPKDFHGVSKFDATQGLVGSSSKSFSSVFGNCLVNMATHNKNICAITAAMTSGTGLVEFSENFKGRFFDVGIAESHAVVFSAGLAKKGLIPVFAVYSTFLQRSYDYLIHDVALQNLKVVLAVDRAGLVGDDGKTHQGVFDVSMLKSVPNTTIFSPTYFDELDFTLQKVVAGKYNLVAVRYPRGHEGYKPTSFITSGNDYDVYGEKSSKTAIVCYGRIFSVAAKVAEDLNVKVIKLNKILPIPYEAVKIASLCDKVLIAEEAVGGIANDFGIKMYQSGFNGKLVINDIQNGFVNHATVERQLEILKLDCKGIADTLHSI
ncbi:MAG: 1-deoxy-D-xylulose-5-phosphate synthase [Clostridia bacterium]